MKHESLSTLPHSLRVVSLFSGIGGFEVGLHRAGHKTVFMCESDPYAQQVLRNRFPETELHSDVTRLSSLPACDLVTAGWPCQDISLAGTTSGLAGTRSGLIEEVFRLVGNMPKKPAYILLENVAFAVELRKGEAIRYVTERLEQLGYDWAYRILDTRLFGLPQRRRRLYVLASRVGDPSQLIFDGAAASMAGPNAEARKVGFYWTEGNRGTGWSPDALPPLKGGSTVGIPSPPAVWDRDNGSFFQPGIEDAERLQGFIPGWTEAATSIPRGERKRWMLVGNAVSVPVAEWIGRRLAVDGISSPGDLQNLRRSEKEFARAGKKTAGASRQFFEPTSEGPADCHVVTLDDFGFKQPKALSARALAGFTSRFEAAPLKKHPDFLRDLRQALQGVAPH
ncbi:MULTISPECIES: DNA cytosine methyltransferase [unclassified Rhizobium]|uniref:DNA cytosine methyltransferase n=1 Tax=unclassified Rhizobium TaxID=2613769 RepID=UPI0007F0A57F|nr:MULTISPECIES: DNA cytosine methyltransferase [unclassified Rhizobium]ANM09538.1 DNA (cytosine-5-)-methyltransferase protein [Rhizobium sp. N324]ANM16008.1 DNA (cytosine-5-)-methyltransferase protein [Rhizobium sp. N541]ANM22396.1 DNA (cytosine-5-)-methyltransferase protein [Rhizobium sp. N941]OYD03106.1 DNA (cytosine-5-)-methyltransferase protein [Rhizobium sp. N4311]